ncbi:MAG: ThuA domain-containing protein, partial [Verrucomicrobia bacterium]|nr:ThuA domain-containing protein [Verrucomicrobiota bacterium]
ADLYCTRFVNHSAVVTAHLTVEDRAHPSTRMLPADWVRKDEWYNFTRNPRPETHPLLTVDETTYQGSTMGKAHPIAWYRTIGKGRLWFTALGHTDESFSEPLLLEHLLGGIQWAAGHAVTTEQSDASFRTTDEALQRDFTATVARRLDGRLSAAEYATALHALRSRELEMFEAIRRHHFDDLTESNHWHRGRLKFPGNIEMEMMSLQKPAPSVPAE